MNRVCPAMGWAETPRRIVISQEALEMRRIVKTAFGRLSPHGVEVYCYSSVHFCSFSYFCFSCVRLGSSFAHFCFSCVHLCSSFAHFCFSCLHLFSFAHFRFSYVHFCFSCLHLFSFAHFCFSYVHFCFSCVHFCFSCVHFCFSCVHFCLSHVHFCMPTCQRNVKAKETTNKLNVAIKSLYVTVNDVTIGSSHGTPVLAIRYDRLHRS